MRTPTALALLPLLAIPLHSGCDSRKKAEDSGRRVEINRVTGNTFELVPTDGQLPYCLVFTRSEKGVVRQLTMTHENKSVPCEPGRPIAGVRFRTPQDEGEVKVHLFFSDRKLSAGSIAQQLHDIGADFNPLNHRFPGVVLAETLSFRPDADDTEITTGVVVGPGGEVIGDGGDR